MAFAGILDPQKGMITLTDDEIEHERERARRALAQATAGQPIGHWTQGAAQVLQALGGAVRENRADQASLANADYNAGLMGQLLGGGQEVAPEAAAASVLSTGGAPQVGTSGATPSPATGGQNPAGYDLRDGIAATASALGISPVDLATAISYETGGTFDPTKAGPTTQWGQHRGLIQFGEPQAKQYGVDWNDPVGSQLGPNGAVANYLRSTGVKPGMGMMDIYSAINAGGVGRYGASDANNGGAPGTVADKVNQQMAGHRQKAMALFPEGGAVQTMPYQVGSSDATAQNMPYQPGEAPAQLQMMGGNAPMMPAQAQPAVRVASADPNDVNPVLMALAQRSGAVPQQGGQEAMQPQAPAQRVAQAMQAAPQQQAPQVGGMNRDALIRVLTDRRASPQTRAVAQALLQQQMQATEYDRRQAYEAQRDANDPMKKLQREALELDVEAKRNPQRALINSGDGRLYDPNSGQWIMAPDSGQQYRQATPEEANRYGSASGQFGPDGRFYPINPPQGTSLSVDPSTGAVTFNQGAGVKPLTEAQSKDVLYATRATNAMPLLDKYEQSLMSLGGAMAERIPMNLGNYAQSEEYQLARDAGRDFLATILRKDTGAAITANEEDIYGKMFLPQPGDKAATINAKRQRRALAVEAIKSGMPLQAIENMTKALDAAPKIDGLKSKYGLE